MSTKTVPKHFCCGGQHSLIFIQQPMLRLPGDKMCKPHNECNNMAEKASLSGKINWR